MRLMTSTIGLQADWLPSFFNTRTRQVEQLSPSSPGHIGLYTCGPTVYRFAHLGNLRSFLLADLVSRICELAGLEIKQVVNITDIGHLTDEVSDRGRDRMLVAAEDEGKSPAELADYYTKAFLRDCTDLNIRRAYCYPRASEHVDSMIELIERLIERGHAYVVDGSVYFDVASFPNYGALSRNTLDSLKAGHRGKIVDWGKRRPEDFLLWRAAGPNRLVKFESPWGEGFPGWHIECSAMSMKYLGDVIDIHTAGIDLIFPHHEDEIAQSDAATGHQVVGHWIHGEHLLMGGSKMAKSSGNTLRLLDLHEAGIDPLAFRLLMFGARYRKQSHFSWEALRSAAVTLEKLRQSSMNLIGVPTLPIPELSPHARAKHATFISAVQSDIDMPSAMRVLYETFRDRRLTRTEMATLIDKWDEVLGLDLLNESFRSSQIYLISDAEIARLLEERSLARESRDYAKADRIRAHLDQAGITVIDSKDGPRWQRRTGSSPRSSQNF